MINTTRYIWKDNGTKLYLGKQYTGFSIGQSYDEPTMFHVLWPDKTPSKDYYNISRAKEHCKAEALKHLEQAGKASGSLTDAFNEEGSYMGSQMKKNNKLEAPV